MVIGGLFTLTGCTEQVKTPIECDVPIVSEDTYATVVEIREAKTYEGVDGVGHGTSVQKQGFWHAEIDIVFSQTPHNLEIVSMSTKHFLRKHKEKVHFADASTDFTKYLSEGLSWPQSGCTTFASWTQSGCGLSAFVEWEQASEIVTLKITFSGYDLFLFRVGGASPLSYEQAKEKHPDLDWNDFVAYTLDFTLHWETNRKRLQGIPIKPSEQILERF